MAQYIQRDTYLQQLINRMDNGEVKIVTGPRRSGKSWLLNRIFKDYLLSKGVPEENIIIVSFDVDDEEEITKSLLVPVEEACKKLDEMRIIEGAKLAEDLIHRGKLIREFAAKIEKRAPMVSEQYAKKLKERITELIGGSVNIPEDRILVEAAIFADKCNITEELVRLDSHTIQLESIITKSNQPDGKKLDFLVQEMNREANTIGSKANDIEITNLMLDIKAEVEKIREQVQNIQ